MVYVRYTVFGIPHTVYGILIVRHTVHGILIVRHTVVQNENKDAEKFFVFFS